MTLPKWFDSIRAWAVIIILTGMTAGMFARIFPVDKYAEAALIVITAYFSKRDTNSERGDQPTI